MGLACFFGFDWKNRQYGILSLNFEKTIRFFDCRFNCFMITFHAHVRPVIKILTFYLLLLCYCFILSLAFCRQIFFSQFFLFAQLLSFQISYKIYLPNA
jgi:hypothetical protein